ncbi:hypothetical protein ACWIFK_05280, partial [Streptomyces althioticus]
MGNDDCREGDGLMNPSFFDDLRTASPRIGEARHPYDRSVTVSREGGCGVVTRTCPRVRRTRASAGPG